LAGLSALLGADAVAQAKESFFSRGLPLLLAGLGWAGWLGWLGSPPHTTAFAPHAFMCGALSGGNMPKGEIVEEE